MAPITNGRAIFAEVPTGESPSNCSHLVSKISFHLLQRHSLPYPFNVHAGYPEPDKHIKYDASETIDLDTVALNGGVLVKILYLSIDPYMRGRMRPENVPSYMVCSSFPCSLTYALDGR